MALEIGGNAESLRMMTKVAHLYHAKGLGQIEIAQRLGLSQARVSRLLAAAKEKGIVLSVVIPPKGIFSELERELELKYGISQVHIVDGIGENSEELTGSLGSALTSVFQLLPLEGKSIGFTSWSRSLRSFVFALPPLQRIKAKKIVELLGGVGEPSLQHLATTATENLARLTNAEPIFLRVPGVISSKDLKDALLNAQSHATDALEEYDSLDIALVGVGAAESIDYGVQESNFFSEKQFQLAKSKGAVAEINLRFIDKDGKPVVTKLDELVIGISLTELRRVPIKIGVSGGESKHEATLALVRGKWVDVLITDNDTAQYLLDH